QRSDHRSHGRVHAVEERRDGVRVLFGETLNLRGLLTKAAQQSHRANTIFPNPHHGRDDAPRAKLMDRRIPECLHRPLQTAYIHANSIELPVSCRDRAVSVPELPVDILKQGGDAFNAVKALPPKGPASSLSSLPVLEGRQ